jgi:DNA-binding HxlR family transcriptional regulator
MLRTAHQRKVLCLTCPVAKAANLVGDSVSVLMLRDLLAKPRRFSDFELSLSGVSTRTIANKLKLFQTQGLVRRDTSRRTEPRITYHLTKKGAALHKVVDEMRTYGKKYL